MAQVWVWCPDLAPAGKPPTVFDVSCADNGDDDHNHNHDHDTDDESDSDGTMVSLSKFPPAREWCSHSLAVLVCVFWAWSILTLMLFSTSLSTPVLSCDRMIHAYTFGDGSVNGGGRDGTLGTGQG